MRAISIPVTDDGTECNLGYIAEFKLTADSDYTRFYPDPTASPIVITGLLDDSMYDLRITRKCCNGSYSAPTLTTVDTTIP
jgi:hypothetical protein